VEHIGRIAPQRLERAASKPFAGYGFQPMSRDDDVGIDILHPERIGAAFHLPDGIHQSVSGGSPDGIGGSCSGSFFFLRLDMYSAAAAIAAEPIAPARTVLVGKPLGLSSAMATIWYHMVCGASQTASSRTSVSRPVTAAAAAMAGLTRCVRAPGPCRPTKLRFDVEAERSPAGTLSGFMPRQAEQPGSRHSR